MNTEDTIFLLPVDDLVMFPKSLTSITIEKQETLNFLKEINTNNDNYIFVVTKKSSKNNKTNVNDLNKIGVLCRIIQKIDTRDEKQRIIIEGIKKAELIEVIDVEKYFVCKIKEIPSQELSEAEKLECDGLKKLLLSKLKEYMSSADKNGNDILLTLDFFKSIDEVIFYVSSFLSLPTQQKQELLEENNDLKKIKKFIELVEIQLSLIKIDKKINDNVEKKFLKGQKKIYLNEKIKMIKKELGKDFDEQEEGGELAEIRKKIHKTKLSPEAKKKCMEEVKKMDGMLPYSSEYQVIKNYLDLVLSLPWGIKSKNDTSLEKAEEILNRDHYGLEKVKERILEYLAVYNRKKTISGQIICLLGAPGVGKTSLAKSIAEALNKKYVKVSLGGIKDEAEIRGHRKTYIGSMPGKIINSLKKAGTSNPLILLDEIDKLGSDYRGDPANALLEVLDPEQNKNFEDHYLDLEFDLSDVMFITTANNISNIPIPLRDRMEIIKLSGYTEDEKLNIAKQHLIPKEIKEYGLEDGEFSITDKAIIEIIRKYTFEAGVRNLERKLAQLIRKSLKKIITNKDITSIKIYVKDLKDYLGAEIYDYNKVSEEDRVGVAVGLAYTDFGGDLLNIESLKFSGNGKLLTTGKLGDVMKESAQAAFSYVRSIADKFNITAKEFNKYDFHLHVPEGATPKDGPSAGVAITASLLSSMTGKKIHKDVAMTGEISLTGKVMPIGGLKEKLLAALRGNIKTVVIPEGNKKDLFEIPDNIKESLNIVPVKNLDEALEIIIKDY